ncbi:hypothetical protein LA080_004278 [Diaporthe eres]|nr:hypothetical protein LA080_004278 [Diaporthe eres]
MANDEALTQTDRQRTSPEGRKGAATLRKSGRLVPVSMRLGVWNRVKAGSGRIADETWEQQNRNTLLSITK